LFLLFDFGYITIMGWKLIFKYCYKDRHRKSFESLAGHLMVIGLKKQK
jgi:hypothetical protein